LSDDLAATRKPQGLSRIQPDLPPSTSISTTTTVYSTRERLSVHFSLSHARPDKTIRPIVRWFDSYWQAPGLKQDSALVAAVSTIAPAQQRRLLSPFSLIEACVVKPIGALALRRESIGTDCYRQATSVAVYFSPESLVTRQQSRSRMAQAGPSPFDCVLDDQNLLRKGAHRLSSIKACVIKAIRVIVTR
jgi:hypothetical protein